MTLQLQFEHAPDVPLEVEGITPDRVRDLSLDAIRGLEVQEGNRRGTLGEFFQVSGDAADERMVWEGDLTGVHWIGAKMTSGEMIVQGPAGRHVGSDMTGGRIEVHGSAGDWVGGEMHGGLIHIHGDAGHLVGAAYRGSAVGMTGGEILIDGRAGNEIGHTMRRGLIAIGGENADLPGFNMIAGTILLCGGGGIRPGAGMRRGTIAFLREAPPLLTSFRFGCRFVRPLFLNLLGRHLQSLDFAPAAEVQGVDFDLHHGDLIDGGRGEILIRA